MTDTVELTLHLVDDTDKAICVAEDDNHTNAQWLPLSQIEVLSSLRLNEAVTIECPVWLARDRGFI
jgi:hypothetical protein